MLLRGKLISVQNAATSNASISISFTAGSKALLRALMAVRDFARRRREGEQEKDWPSEFQYAVLV